MCRELAVDVCRPRSADLRPPRTVKTNLFAAGLVVRMIDGLRLWRTFLAKDDAEKNQGAHRHELTLPILERFEPHPRGREVRERCHTIRPAVRRLILVVYLCTS